MAARAHWFAEEDAANEAATEAGNEASPEGSEEEPSASADDVQ